MGQKLQKDVWVLLRENISRGQLIGYAIANIVGLAVVLAGVLFYADSQHSRQESDSYFSSDYIVLSKKVEGFGFASDAFTSKDIDELERQPWVNKVGKFTSSQYAVYGSIDVGGRGLSSYLFFESVPDEYFDVKPKDWGFDPDKRFVPIVVNKDYLSLYNFGFAAPQGLPQVSEDLVGAVPIKIMLYGKNNYPETFDASIVGFSSRLNTIAVPQSFMDWANDKFAPGMDSEPSRLILEIDRLRSEDMNEYLTAKGYEIGGDKADTSNVSSFLATVSGVVASIGIIICALALFILVLSILLMLQKSRATLRNLMLQGYAPSSIGRYYMRLLLVSNCTVAMIAFIAAMLARLAWSESLAAIGLGSAPIWGMAAVAIGYFVLSMLLDAYIVKTHLLRIWHNK